MIYNVFTRINKDSSFKVIDFDSDTQQYKNWYRKTGSSAIMTRLQN